MRLQNVPVLRGANLTTGQRLVTDIPRALYLWGFRLTFRGRYTLAAGPATSLLPEGLLNLVQRVQLNYSHDIYGNDTPLDVPGPTLFTYRELYSDTPGPGQLDVSTPLSLQNNSYDYQFTIDYQFPPENTLQKQWQFFLLDAPRTSLLQLVIQWGGPGAATWVDGATQTITAFGSGSGSPTVDIDVIQVLDQAHNPLTSMVRRVSREIDLSGSPFPVTRDLIVQLPTGESIRSVLLRQYVRDTTAGQPTSAALTLVDPVVTTDSGISDVGIRVNSKFIREWNSFQALQEQNSQDLGLPTMPLGIGLIDFVTNRDIDRALFTQDFVTRRLQLDLAGTVVTQSNGRVELLTTSVKPNPQMGRGAGKSK